MLCQLLNKTVYTPKTPRLAPFINAAAWRRLCGAERFIAEGNEVLANRRIPPKLSISAWLRFTQTGDRVTYETPYFDRRRALCALAMAECAEGKGRFLPAVADYVLAICEEPAWQLPAHNSYRRDMGALPLPDPDRPVIDLFAAETGATLAVLHNVLGPQLEEYSHGISERISAEVHRRVLHSYLTSHFWWMADTDDPLDRPTCNWTPWCTQNVLIASTALLPAEKLPPYVEKAAKGLDSFLDNYGPDGCCDEGAQYYSHAALALYNSLALMSEIAPAVFDTVWNEPKLKNMAEYILHMHIDGPYYLNFADCSPLAGRRGAREYLFAERVGSDTLKALAARDFAVNISEGGRISHDTDTAAGISLYERIQGACAEEDILAFAATLEPESITIPDIWYPSVGILSTRRGDYVLGVKAGNNADSHNHNDVGSVTLYKCGNPLLIDVGVESYTAKTFSAERYGIWTMQSSWHNLPEFDPDCAAFQQYAGETARAENVKVDDDLGGITMELSAAYGTVPGLGSYIRRVRLTPQGLNITDTTDYHGTVALNLMSVQKPEIDGDIIRFGTSASASVIGAERFETEAVPISDPRLRAVWPEKLYRTRVYFKGALTVDIH